jgi:N-methylhydantoinase A
MNRFVGVDIGGTNTDLIFVDLDERTLTTAKVPTTAHNQAEGLITGIDALGVAPSQIDLLVHGTTVATNATIERKGARCGLITTAGFRDVLELRRRDRPHTYGLDGDFRPHVPPHLRREVAERVSAEGEVLVDIDQEALRVQMRALMDAGCEVLVVCFLHAYVNPVHEQVAKEVAREVWHNDYVVLSSEVLPTLREFERTSTTVISGYVQPLIGRYLSRLADELKQAAYHRELLVVQSNGGVMSASMATRFAANTILSGPAAGVTAAMSIASDLNMANVVSCDMGGTSLDICVIRDGVATLTQNSLIDFGIPLGLPMLDVDAIGAGGGSIARIDGAGILQVGPQSAGANPGPACYGRGGIHATVTDASVAVGLLRPDSAIGKQRGSGMAPELSRAVIQDAIADPLRLSVEQAAEAILTLTGAKMAGHVQRKLLEQGLDPRSFSVIAFGGAGPVHANRILREAGLARAIIPYFPGITSALGCILGQLRHDFLRTVNRSLGQLDDVQLSDIYSAQSEEGRAIVREEGHLDGDEEIRYSADMCYRGQSNVIPVPLGSNALPGMGELRQAFEASYLELYGRLLDADTEIMLVNARTVVSVAPKVASIRDLIRLPDGPVAEPEYVKVYFDGDWHATAQYDRLELPAGTVIKGPALLMQPDSTCFVEPGYKASVHESGNIFIVAE